jgi:hypothetical protein
MMDFTSQTKFLNRHEHSGMQAGRPLWWQHPERHFADHVLDAVQIIHTLPSAEREPFLMSIAELFTTDEIEYVLYEIDGWAHTEALAAHRLSAATLEALRGAVQSAQYTA